MHHTDETKAILTFDHALARQCAVVATDLAKKHEKMARSPFAFLRATYFLWRRWLPTLSDSTGAPTVLSIGDVHAENFGTWRDAEARLVYGVNDLDEVGVLPYDNDVLRLATSLLLADGREITEDEVVGAVLAGYREGLTAPRPCLPDERDADLRPLVAVTDKERHDFWRKFDGDGDIEPPRAVRRLLKRALPKGASGLRFRARQAGLGGLGKPRYVVIADWQGGRILRETKLFLPSAVIVGDQDRDNAVGLALKLDQSPCRARDPFWAVQEGWMIRRLSAGNRKIELEEADRRLQVPLIMAMAREVGSLHAMSKSSDKILKHLEDRPKLWLRTSVEEAREEVIGAYSSFAGRERGGEAD